MMKVHQTFAAIAIGAMAFSCQPDEQAATQRVDDSPLFRNLPTEAIGRQARSGYRILSASYLAADESGQVGRTVYFNNIGNKQLAADFVAGAQLDGTNAVSYYVDRSRPSADLDVEVSSDAIGRAMNTWDGVICSNLGMFEIPAKRKVSTGYVSELLGFGGSFNYVADVVHAGWLPAAFFDFIAPEGSTFILGATFTITFTDEDGNYTDMDNDGKVDVAWREIYYNDAFTWNNGDHYDVETIALHEAGHGLSQEHFGTAFADAGTGKIHFSPFAVMNAAYIGIQTDITATDNGGHCSIWSAWPNP